MGMGGNAHAAVLYDVSINANDIVFDPVYPILNQQVQVYVTLTNNGEKNVEGSAVFYVDDQRIGAKAFSVRANGRPEDVWLPWTPSSLGSHRVRVDIANDPDYPDANPDNNSVSEAAIVDVDTDGDGVPDRLDGDRDNDGLTNEQEATLHTNPLKRDTDGDGVGDKEDFYPLDPAHTRYTPPAVIKPTPVKVSASERPLPTKTLTTPPSSVGIVGVGEEKDVSSTSHIIEIPVVTEVSETSSLPVAEAIPPATTSVDLIFATSSASSTSAGSPYRILWGVAGATGVLSLSFVALDWRQRRREEG